MESQEAPEEEHDRIIHLLTEANQLDDVDSNGKVSAILDTVICYLRSEPPVKEGVQTAKMTFEMVLPRLGVDEASLGLFRATFSFLKCCYDSSLEGCAAKDAAAMSHVAELLQQCCNVLECCEMAVQFLLQADKIAIEDLGSVPTVFLHIVASSLSHCKESETIYSDQLHQVKDCLTRFFQLSVNIATNFANLSPKLTYDTLLEQDLQILTEVCEKLCTTAVCLSQLSEVRGSVMVWRAYASLINHYHRALASRLVLSGPVAALVNEIKDGLQTLASLPLKNSSEKEKQTKMAQRIIKMTSFCLKIVIALCEKFHGYLMDCHATLVLLILLLFKFAPKNVVLSDYPEDIKKDFEKQVFIGIEPLLIHLKDDDDFIEEARESVNKEESVVDDWGCHIVLLTAILFPLRSSIRQHMNSIVSLIFKATDKGHVSLSFPCLMDGVMYKGKPLTAVTLYEHTAMRVCAAVATFDPQQFELLESDLVHWLLTGHTWSSLLAADVWCFIARYGTSDLCKTHVIVLLEILSRKGSALTPNQRSALGVLLSRLMEKLSPSHREVILSQLQDVDFKDKHSRIWLRTILCKDTVKQNSVEDLIQHMNKVTSKSATAEDVINLMESLQEQAMKLKESSTNMNEQCVAAAPSITAVFVQLWARIPVRYIRCSIVEQLIGSLLKISPSLMCHLSSSQFLQI